VVHNYDDDFDRIEPLVAAKERRDEAVTRLDKVLKQPTIPKIRDARREFMTGALAKDPEIIRLLKELPAAHQSSIRFTVKREPPLATPVAEDSGPSLVVAVPLEQSTWKPRPGQRPMLAVARGVLYALEPHNGAVRWARRVGVDITSLPVW